MNTSIVTTPALERPLGPNDRRPDRFHSRHGAADRLATVRQFGPDAVALALQEGRWVELWPGVLVNADRLDDPVTRASAALFRAGPTAVLSGLTAAAMHGCRAATTGIVHVTVPYDTQRRSQPGLAVHQGVVREHEVQELDGLRVHALDVALTDILCTARQRQALCCVEQALGGLPPAESVRLHALLAERLATRRDRRGTKTGAALLSLVRTGPEARVG